MITAFVDSQFGYCPLVWMFHNRGVNSKVNRLQERALRLLFKDDISTFEQLLEKAGIFTIHQRNIQSLAIEMYKVKNNIGPQLMNEIFIKREYQGPVLKSMSNFIKPCISSIHFGKDSLQSFEYRIWNLIPSNIKEICDLNEFKRKIRNWVPGICPCIASNF